MHQESFPVEEMAISKLKATCFAVLERVRKSRRPIRVTRFGQPVAETVPPSPLPNNKHWLGTQGQMALAVSLWEFLAALRRAAGASPSDPGPKWQGETARCRVGFTTKSPHTI
jgi:hypothetical protein